MKERIKRILEKYYLVGNSSDRKVDLKKFYLDLLRYCDLGDPSPEIAVGDFYDDDTKKSHHLALIIRYPNGGTEKTALNGYTRPSYNKFKYLLDNELFLRGHFKEFVDYYGSVADYLVFRNEFHYAPFNKWHDTLYDTLLTGTYMFLEEPLISKKVELFLQEIEAKTVLYGFYDPESLDDTVAFFTDITARDSAAQEYLDKHSYTTVTYENISFSRAAIPVLWGFYCHDYDGDCWCAKNVRFFSNQQDYKDALEKEKDDVVTFSVVVDGKDDFVVYEDKRVLTENDRQEALTDINYKIDQVERNIDRLFVRLDQLEEKKNELVSAKTL